MVGWHRNGTQPPAECPPYSALETDPIVAPNSNESVERTAKKNEAKWWSLCKPLKDEIVESFPTYWPIFTVISGLLEIALVTVVMMTNTFAPVQFTIAIETRDIVGFGGVNVSVTKDILPNPFVGPSKAAMIHAGAKYPVVRAAVFVSSNMEVQATWVVCIVKCSFLDHPSLEPPPPPPPPDFFPSSFPFLNV